MYQSFIHDHYNTYYYTPMNNSPIETNSPEFRARSQTWGGNDVNFRSRDDDVSPSQHYMCGFDSLNSRDDSGNSLNNFSVQEKNDLKPDIVTKGSGVKKTSRKNPWGQETYADLIESAICSHPNKMATLQQIYDHISKNYKYFLERSDATSSAGWKNSIRHNLSLHDKFLKCPKKNENMKSSLWSINQNSVKRMRSNSMDCKKNSMDLIVKRRYAKERRGPGANFNSVNEPKRCISKTDKIVKSETLLALVVPKEEAMVEKSPEFLGMESDLKYMPPDLSLNTMSSPRDHNLHKDIERLGMSSMEPIFNCDDDNLFYDREQIPDFHIAELEYSKFVAELFIDDND